MLINAVEAELLGDQPYHRLRLRLELQSFQDHPEVFVTADFADSSMTPVMEACPSFLPFIPASPEPVWYEIEIDLPPLVPGVYSVSPWIGSAYNVRYDKVPGAVQFEILVSPDPQRTFKHYSDHGYVVPFSRVVKSGRGIPMLTRDGEQEAVLDGHQPFAV